MILQSVESNLSLQMEVSINFGVMNESILAGLVDQHGVRDIMAAMCVHSPFWLNAEETMANYSFDAPAIVI